MDWLCRRPERASARATGMLRCPHRSKLARLEIRYHSFRNHYDYAQRHFGLALFVIVLDDVIFGTHLFVWRS